MTGVIIATQAREGIETTQEQAESAYFTVQMEKNGLPKAPEGVTSILNLRYALRTDDWYLFTNLGWFWCGAEKEWKPCPYGPL